MVPPVNLPDTFRYATVPELPAEPGYVKLVLTVLPEATLPKLTGNAVVVATGESFVPNVDLVMVRLTALR